MYGPFLRAGKTVTVTVANGQTDSSIIDTRGYAWAVVQFGTITGTTLGFKGANTPNTSDISETSASVVAATFVSIYDETGTIYALTAGSDRIVSIPAYALVSPWLKLVLAAQGSLRTFTVTLLS